MMHSCIIIRTHTCTYRSALYDWNDGKKLNTLTCMHTVSNVPYSKKFSRVLIFAVFADQYETAKFVTLKILLTTFTAYNAIAHCESARAILEN